MGSEPVACPHHGRGNVVNLDGEKIIFYLYLYLFKRVEAAAKVIEGLATTNGNNLAISQALEIEIADLLKLIQSAKLKTIKGSIDERDALRRSLGM